MSFSFPSASGTPVPYLPPSTKADSGQTEHDPKLEASAKEFESVLLTQWLQSAESSFGAVPGGEDDDDGTEQLKSFAVQCLARAFSNAGGVGIGTLVLKALQHSENTSHLPHSSASASR